MSPEDEKQVLDRASESRTQAMGQWLSIHKPGVHYGEADTRSYREAELSFLSAITDYLCVLAERGQP